MKVLNKTKKQTPKPKKQTIKPKPQIKIAEPQTIITIPEPQTIISKLQTLYNKHKKQILYIALGLITMYGMIWLMTPKPQMPSDLKATIDLLSKTNIALEAKQKQIDSTIALYKVETDKIDFKIKNIKEKTTIIREYYHEINQGIGKYTNSQVDSFFKQRYGY